MDGDVFNLDPLEWTRLFVHGDFLPIIQDVDALDDLGKDGVLPVQMRRRGKGDEELTAV